MPAPLAALLAFTVAANAGPRHTEHDDEDRHARRAEPAAEVVTDDPVQSLANARADLADIRAQLARARDRDDLRRVQRRLARLDLMLEGTERTLWVWQQERQVAWRYRPAPIAPPEVWASRHRRERVDPGPQAMAAADFARLVGLIEAAAFSSEKLSLVEDAVQHHFFTAEQARDLIALQTFGADKVQTGQLLHDRCVDPQKWLVVYAAFDFQSDARELRSRLAAR